MHKANWQSLGSRIAHRTRQMAARRKGSCTSRVEGRQTLVLTGLALPESVPLFLAVLTFLAAVASFGCGGGAGGTGTRPISVSLQSKADVIDQGYTETITATLNNDTTHEGVTWSMLGAGSLSNQTATKVEYEAPATVSSPTYATIIATSVAQSSSISTVIIHVNPPPKVATTSLPGGYKGVQYAYALGVTGGTGDLTWKASSGSLPPWASIQGDIADGYSIIGTPGETGTWNFSLMVTDDFGLSSNPQPLSLTVGIAPPPTVTTSLLPAGTQRIPYYAELQATGGGLPYTWSVVSGTLPSWAKLDSATSAITGIPDSEGTSSFTIQAASAGSMSPSSPQELSITVKAPDSTNNAELNGQYAFLLQGFDDATGNQFAVVGSFIADGNGNITGGLEDRNGPGGYQPALSFHGTYSVGSDNRGFAIFTNSSGDTSTFALAAGSLNSSHVAAKAGLIEFDDISGATGKRGSGSVYLQTPDTFNLASVQGPYAFQMVGQTFQTGTRAVVTGAYTVDGKGNLTTGEEDVNENGDSRNRAFTGTFSTTANTASFGRMIVQGLADAGASHSVAYLVDSSHAIVVTTGSESTSGLLSGEVLARKSSSFSAASLNSTSVGYSVGTSWQTAGRWSFDGSGFASYRFRPYFPNGTGYYAGTTLSYSVSPNGRVTTAGTLRGAPSTWVFYLVNANEGYLMSMDSSADRGYFEAQTTGTFSTASLSGNYFLTTITPSGPDSKLAAGVLSSSGDGTWNTTLDTSEPPNALRAAQNGSETYVIDGEGEGLDDEFLPDYLYMISPKKAFLIWEPYGSNAFEQPMITIVQK